jgi:hypothetical protein
MLTEHLYLPRQGDRDLLLDFYNQFKRLSDEALLKECESAKKLGIVGSHAQGLRLIALYKVTKNRSIPSGICLEDNCLISFKD